MSSVVVAGVEQACGAGAGAEGSLRARRRGALGTAPAPRAALTKGDGKGEGLEALRSQGYQADGADQHHCQRQQRPDGHQAHGAVNCGAQLWRPRGRPAQLAELEADAVEHHHAVVDGVAEHGQDGRDDGQVDLRREQAAGRGAGRAGQAHSAASSATLHCSSARPRAAQAQLAPTPRSHPWRSSRWQTGLPTPATGSR